MKTICTNRKALHEYFVLDTIEAGIVLKGTEIKSIIGHKVSLDGAYACIESDELWLVGCNIDPYVHGTHNNHDPKRKRKLLLHRQEISKFAAKAEQIGHTIIPLSVYIGEKGKAKIQLAVCQGKKLHDKRQAIKDKDLRRSQE